MCPKCNNTGIIRKEIYPGVIETKGCDCEVAKQQEAWLQRFAEWEKGCSVSNVVRGYQKGRYAI
ncbi:MULTISPECIES: hypothetical protein [Bacillus cereus group]|uniref:Uncharacterized protein n=1 Tax=Bacillus proteolyticus TaxID=2026192 RepID=A0ABV3IAJ0_9BACI|nr:hypothetical protein [Bacillus cereus group sp. N8]MBJ8105981.1 hypothetical protein [Bacillus cereus group sp. N8]